ncbi:unnamed protein product [Vicia faba]|uniref:Polygalacturonase n=1 Tax=Vicia faba TaxID=3906 RepID=A0AAV0YUD3_VICFA|nr:unnamed protein product [Vicia faba]
MTKLSISIIVSFLFLAYLSVVQGLNFDITKYGGTPNSDITQAFIKVWKEACASPGAAKIVIPSGKYRTSGIDAQGPCKSPIEIQVDGTIQAPSDINQCHKGIDQWIRFGTMDHLTLSGKGIFDGQGAATWKQGTAAWSKNHKVNNKVSMNMGFYFVNNSIITGITSKDSKNFHFMVYGCENITFDGVKVSAPGDSTNTDGIHLGKSTDVKILNTDIATGDDCVSLGDGSKKVLVQNVNCGPGHGISVGSLGKFQNEDNVEGLTVKNCKISDTENGVRIKTWPSGPGTLTITDMRFEDITMNNVRNPIIIDQEYCPWNQCNKKNPSKIRISKVIFKNIKGTTKAEEGVVLICSSGVPCDGVELSNIDLKFNGKPAKAVCSNVKPIVSGISPKCEAYTPPPSG